MHFGPQLNRANRVANCCRQGEAKGESSDLKSLALEVIDPASNSGPIGSWILYKPVNTDRMISPLLSGFRLRWTFRWDG